MTRSATESSKDGKRGTARYRALFVTLAALTLATSAAAERLPRYRPDQAATIVATIPAAVQQAVAARNTPVALAQLRAWIELAVTTEDTRLLGHVEARLAPLLDDPETATEALFLKAWAEQHRHDFNAALRNINTVLIHEPRHLGALRTRAMLMLATGAQPELRRHCAQLLLAGDADYARLCTALWLHGESRLQEAAAALDALISNARDANTRDEARRARAVIALALSQPEIALLAIDGISSVRPADLRLKTRVQIARGEPATALPTADLGDEALLLRALASTRQARADADAMRQLFLDRLAERERADDDSAEALAVEYFLDVAPDPQRASAHARRLLTAARDPMAIALARRAGVPP